MDVDAQLATPAIAAGAIVDTLRQLLSVLGALLASSSGQRVAQDAEAARSLPALGKALRRCWFETPIGNGWESKEQAVWLCRLLTVTEGARAGILSFYGAGLLLNDVLIAFAEVTLTKDDTEPLDEAWVRGAIAVQDTLRGRHYEQLQRWPADRRCGGGSDPLISVNRLPSTLRRTLDLEGYQLTRTQAAGLGIAMFLPGTMTLAMSGVGAALLIRSARDHAQKLETGDSSQWHGIQTRCLQHAHLLLRRKECPIEVLYLPTQYHSHPNVKVCLYSVNDPLCAVPVGKGLGSGIGGGTGGEGTARLSPGERCFLRPVADADSFRMRVYQPAELFDVLLHDGIEVRRGDRIVVAPTANGRYHCVLESQLAVATGGTQKPKIESTDDSNVQG